MIFQFLKLNVEITDDDFNAIYPKRIERLSKKHWTPVVVAKLASEYLVSRPGDKILDIGSGAGKFCLVGAAHTKGQFTGVEQRLQLVKLSKRISHSYNIHNAAFIHANITTINFRDFDACYFYNSFYENIDLAHKIDNTVNLDVYLYDLYSRYIADQLSSMRIGTRLATYYGPSNIVPGSYKLQDSLQEGRLQYWLKVEE
jgi:tRNA A58 N-methylase Trm61